MASSVLDSIIVGAGQAGLDVSYFLKQSGIQHVLFERRQIGESWLAQRWDSFQLNTPNSMNTLPGLPYDGPEPDGFWRVAELAVYFRRYIDYFNLPVCTGVMVHSVEQEPDSPRFLVNVQSDGQSEETLLSRSVVIASGSQRKPKIPAIHTRLPDWVTQLHTAEYCNPEALPAGAVVIVGSGQSGCQVAEELLAAGRRVYLCTSKVGRSPRRYRGRDMLEWLAEMKFMDTTFDSLQDKSIARAAQPQTSGVGRYGHTVSLQFLSRQGAVILGRLLDVQEGSLVLSDEAAAHVRFGDEFSQRLKEGVDTYLKNAGIVPPPLEDDPADAPDPQATCVSPLTTLPLGDAEISSVIWATGFTADFSWIHLPVLDQDGQPVHQRGISPVPGLYFLGFPWLNSRKSGIIYGIEEDAGYIARDIAEKVLHG